MKLADAMALIDAAQFEFLTVESARKFDIYYVTGEIEQRVIMVAELDEDSQLVFDLQERTVQCLTMKDTGDWLVFLDGNLPNYGIRG